MYRSTYWLTLATLAGLAAGFAREWLLITQWGAGSRSDAFLVALFVPEAIRMTMAGGLLTAAALPLYAQREETARAAWLNGLNLWILLSSMLLWILLAAGAPLWIKLIGPGLSPEAQIEATKNLLILASCVPGFILHALLSIPLQARERFVLPGLGSLLFNLPPVLYLGFKATSAEPQELAWACVLGSLLMPMSLFRPCWSLGWRPNSRNSEPGAGRDLLIKIKPLLGSNLASHGLVLLERIVASLLGEGAITWINLARKLINLPLIAIMNLNQVLLGMMSARQAGARLALLEQGLATVTLLSLPAALGLIGASPTLVKLLFPEQSVGTPLPTLLAWFAVPLVFGAWNALLARYAYAGGNTSLPLRCELWGGLSNALLLAILPFITGVSGIALATLTGTLITGVLLMQRLELFGVISWVKHWLLCIPLLILMAALIHPMDAGWLQLGLSTLTSSIALIALALWLKPWRTAVRA